MRVKFYISTKWMDPFRVKNFDKVHKVDGPYKGSTFVPTKWIDPTWVNY